MRLPYLIVLAIAFAALVGFAQQPPPATRPAGAQAQIDLLFKQLAAEDWQVRQKAQDDLVKRGAEVLPDLQRLRRGTNDEEVRTRADAAINQILTVYSQFVQFKFTPNADVVTEKPHTPQDPGATSGIDIGGSCFLSQSEALARGAGRGRGLPDDGRIGELQLLPYNQNNVARRADNTPIDIEFTPGRYSTVTFYACTGSDTSSSIPGANVSATFTYSNGEPGSKTFLIPDWALRPAGVTCLIDDLDRTRWSPQGTVGVGWEYRTANWAIFSFPIPVDATRTLTSVRLARTDRGVVNLFAVSGMAVPDTNNAPFVQAMATTRPAPRIVPPRTTRPAGVLVMGGALPPAVVARPGIQPLPAALTTRFVQFKITPNADVIAERHEAPGDPGVNAAIDAAGACFLSASEALARGGEPARGLPDNGRIGDVQLLPFDQNNVARRADAAPIEVDITPGRYATIHFYACAGDDAAGPTASAYVTALLTYSAGAPSVSTLSLPNWSRRLLPASSLIIDLGRTRASPQAALAVGYEYRTPGWSIFKVPVSADPNRTLVGLRLMRSGPQGIVNVFAVSGMAVTDDPATRPAVRLLPPPAARGPMPVPQAVIDLFQQQALSDNADRAVAAVRSLAAIVASNKDQAAQVASALEKVAASDSAAVRAEVAAALGPVAVAMKATEPSDTLRKLASPATEKAPDVRMKAIKSIGLIPRAGSIEPMIDALLDEDVEVRSSAFQAWTTWVGGTPPAKDITSPDPKIGFRPGYHPVSNVNKAYVDWIKKDLERWKKYIEQLNQVYRS